VRLTSEAQKKIEALERALREIDELTIQMEIMKNNAILEEHKRAAGSLINALNELARVVDPDYVADRLPLLKKEAGQLYEDFEETQTRDQTRRFVLKNIQEVLVEMGYDVLSAQVPGDNAQPAYLTLKTPDNEIARIGFGLDNSVFAEFAHLARDNGSGGAALREVLISKCRRWCEDYDLMQKNLVARDVILSDKWRTAPEEGRYEAIYVESQNYGSCDDELTEEDYFLHNAGQGEIAYGKK
jgi:hypothetical protein